MPAFPPIVSAFLAAHCTHTVVCCLSHCFVFGLFGLDAMESKSGTCTDQSRKHDHLRRPSPSRALEQVRN